VTLESLLADVAAAVSVVAPRASTKGYLFGSALRPSFRWTDVDILIVCDNAEDIARMRALLMPVCAAAPVDLLLMSSAEEAELNFVSGQGCRLLFKFSP